ncbi:ran-specific GTPase-activating protein-like [Dermacentor albipictus]|uniref:ran-specific GTPase-activating protein-like n=1 Tax=Dermacentor albipictus TaxID=60249 RepID=UPI0031FBAC10
MSDELNDSGCVDKSRNDSVSEHEDERSHSPDIHFEPVMKLPLIDVKTLEEDEEVLVKLRGKLYRYVTAPDEAPEWKERGTGEVKILCNKSGHCRILMRRDKTFKVCANHYVHPGMELKPSHGSDKAWVWSTVADFADEEPKPELLALRFGSVENAQKFKEKFEEAKRMQIELLKEGKEAAPGSEVPTKELESLAIKEEAKEDKAGDSSVAAESEKSPSGDSADASKK